MVPAGTGAESYQTLQPVLPDAAAISALGIFGDASPEREEEALPANPAEWLASLGKQEEDVTVDLAEAPVDES